MKNTPTPAPEDVIPIVERGAEVIRRITEDVEPPPLVPDTHPGPRIGVALGGGSARGLTHIPYIEAMDELGLRPSVIAGTSIGALIGSGWASGMTGAELREHSYAVLGTMKIIASRLWGAQVRNLSRFFSKGGFSVLLDAERVVDAFLPDPFPYEFKDLQTEFYVVATDFQSWHQAVFNAGPLRQAIAGSIAIPGLFNPVQFANHFLVDGGVVNPLPLDQAADCDILVGIDVNGDPSDMMNKTNHGLIDVWFGSAQIMMHSLTAHMMAAYPPDVYVRPHLNSFGVLEYWRVREIVSHVEQDKDNFKRALATKVEAFMADQDVTSMRAEDR